MQSPELQKLAIELIETYGPEVQRRLANAVVGARESPAIADELCQDWRFRIIKNIHKYRGACSKRTWCHIAAKHILIDWKKRASRKYLKDSLDEIISELDRLMTDSVFAEGGSGRLDELRSQLTPAENAVLDAYLQHENIEEAAKWQGTTLAAARKRIERIIQKLREYVQQRSQTEINPKNAYDQ